MNREIVVVIAIVGLLTFGIYVACENNDLKQEVQYHKDCIQVMDRDLVDCLITLETIGKRIKVSDSLLKTSPLPVENIKLINAANTSDIDILLGAEDK